MCCQCLICRGLDEESALEVDESRGHGLQRPDLVLPEVEPLQEVLQRNPLAHFEDPVYLDRL